MPVFDMITSVKYKVKWWNKEVCGENKENLSSLCTLYSKVYSNLVPHRKVSSLRVSWGGEMLGWSRAALVDLRSASGWGSFQRHGLQICNAFLLVLKRLMAEKPKHADNMGSVGINTTVTLQGFWNWENMAFLCISRAEGELLHKHLEV